MSWHVSLWVYPVWNSVCFLDLGHCSLFHVRETFDYNLFKHFLRPSLFFFFWNPSNAECWGLMLFQEPLKLPSFLFILSSLFCSAAAFAAAAKSLQSCPTLCSSVFRHHIFHPLIHSSASVILLLIPSGVFFMCCSSLFIH